MKHIAHHWVMSLNIYEPGKPIDAVARELGFASADEIVKLAANENALGPSPRAVRAMKKAAGQMHFYPDSGAHYLRQALAGRLKVKPEQIMVTNGSNEAIEFMGHVFMAPGVEVVVADRAFAIYRLVAGMFQARAVCVPMKALTHDLDAMLAAITPRTKLVFIANPNNPTGTMVDGRALDRFMDRVPAHVVVGLDEAYIELLDPKRQPDTLKYVREGRPIIIMRTFSKTYGLAGLRIGYAVAAEEGINLMHRVRQPFNVNAMGLAAALAALDDETYVRKTRRMVRDGLAYFAEQLPRLGLKYVPSVANFMLVETGDSRKVFEALQKERVIVRPMDGYGLPEHVRITVGLPHENAHCIRALAKVLGRHPPVG